MEISFLSLYQNAHIVVKIVIYILTLFSVISWCVFVAKVIGYERLAKSIKKQRQTAKNLKS
ncbi:MAG: MotA/TolQ/ExbB proton channel family protein, partial [Campylobacter sp.]|nr:MotA/TolQ/ExbB proton channel family protein [Campylobacter sp.]